MCDYRMHHKNDENYNDSIIQYVIPKMGDDIISLKIIISELQIQVNFLNDILLTHRFWCKI